MDIEELKKTIHEGSDTQLNEAISKGALKLETSQIATVSFVFWLVYMAESDLNDVLRTSWDATSKFFTPEVNALAEKQLLDGVGGGRKININQPEYFSDKIKIYEAMFGKTERARVLWKLNDIRNDLSHNRIDALSYNGQELAKRETKEKVLIDYFRTALDTNVSTSPFWTSLTDEEKAEITAMFDQIKNGHQP